MVERLGEMRKGRRERGIRERIEIERKEKDTKAVLPTYRIFPFSNGFWPQNTTPENSVSFNGINYLHSMSEGFFFLI